MCKITFCVCIHLCVYIAISAMANEWATETCKDDLCEINKNNINNRTSAEETQGMLSQAEESKARALNFTMDDHNVTNVITPANNSNADVPAKIMTGTLPKKKTVKDLSDVSMDDDDDENVDTAQMITTDHPNMNSTTMKLESIVNSSLCEDSGKKYMKGEKIERGCDEMCECMDDGSFNCKPRCAMPFFRKGKQLHDPLCSEKPVDDPCCAIMVCASDTETEPLELCSFNNKTYHRGETFNEGCSNVCTCEYSGKVKCKSRCPPITQKSSDACVTVDDPNDPCCQIVLCDVTLNDQDTFNKETTSLEPSIKLSSENINQTTVRLSIEATNINTSIDSVEISEDRRLWRSQKLLPENLVNGLEAGHMYYIKIGSHSNVIEVDIPGTKSPEQTEVKENVTDGKCVYKNVTYTLGQEFHDECTAYCMCEKTGVMCVKFECPTNFGLDVLDPHCLDWEPVPANFTPKAPNCCAEKVRCVRNGSCMHEGVQYQNFAEIPSNITGCHRRCYCEMGKVECQNACPPVTAKPPNDLPCSPHEATLQHREDDDCCLYWMCGETLSQDVTKGTGQDRPLDVHLNQSDNSDGFLLPTPITPVSSNEPYETIPKLLSKPSTTESSKIMTKPGKTDKPSKPYTSHTISNMSTASIPTIFSHMNKSDNNENNTSVKYQSPEVKNKTNENKIPYLGPLAPNYQNIPSKGTDKYSTFPENSWSNPLKPSLPHYPKPQSVKPGKNNPVNIPPYSNPPNKKTQTDIYPVSVNEDQHPDGIYPINDSDTEHFELGIKKNKPIFENFPPNIRPFPEPANPQNHFPSDLPKRIKPQTQDTLTPEEIIHLIHQQHPDLIHSAPPGSVIKVQNIPVNEQYITNGPGQPFIHPQFGPVHPNSGPINQLNTDKFLQHIHGGNRPQFPSQFPHPLSPPPINDHYYSNPDLQLPPQAANINLTQTAGFNPGFQHFPVHPAFNQPKDEITILDLEALNENTIRLVFTVPPILVGLHGRVELRYTSKKSEDQTAWNLQVFAPPNDLIATPQLEFELPGLEPDTEYRIKITIMLRDLHNTPSSRIYTVRTPPSKPNNAQTTLPSIIPIEPNMSIGEVNATWVTLVWRKFTNDELQFIDGVQIRYKEVNGMVYAATPLIHRAVTSYTLENLKPETDYEIGIYFIPFHGQQTELKSDKMLHVTTLQEIDVYGFNVTLEVRQVKSTSVEVYWSGVPYPEDKYVNIYRAIYQSEHGKEDFSTFKIAKRDSPAKTIIRDLKPATHYHLWLEVYLTNGRIKTSNVQDFMTKEGVPQHLDHASQQVKSSGVTQMQEGHEGDYYGPLVVVAIIAALAILATLILLLVLVRRYGQHKAAITAPAQRVSQASYDNPTYKIELQQETMNL